jgi:hypothetical protein
MRLWYSDIFEYITMVMDCSGTAKTFPFAQLRFVSSRIAFVVYGRRRGRSQAKGEGGEIMPSLPDDYATWGIRSGKMRALLRLNRPHQDCLAPRLIANVADAMRVLRRSYLRDAESWGSCRSWCSRKPRARVPPQKREERACWEIALSLPDLPKPEINRAATLAELRQHYWISKLPARGCPTLNKRLDTCIKAFIRVSFFSGLSFCVHVQYTYISWNLLLYGFCEGIARDKSAVPGWKA